jgi:colanic acid biosynthesis glycosyl transferase WcaI
VRYDGAGRQRFRREHGLDGKYVVMHSGNHSPCHPLTTLLEAARRLNDRSDIAFCFVGGGSEFETVRRFAQGHELRNVVMLPYQPLDKLGSSLSAADLHTVVMGDPFVGLVHPCKVYNIGSLGIPYLYIGPAESHVSDLAPTYTATHGDVDSVVRHIRSAAENKPARRDGSHSADVCSQRQLISKMVSALEAAASKQPASASELASISAAADS